MSNGRADHKLLVEVLSEGPHCVVCEYCISVVQVVSEEIPELLNMRVVETKRAADAKRYIELCRMYGGLLPVPSILFNGRLVFRDIPGPEELRRAIEDFIPTEGNS
jgi:predicted thioredoxin/glutaredoxin